jgi:hypothetical protein
MKILGSNGYIGVNKFTPGYPLDVTGNINCTGALMVSGGTVNLDGVDNNIHS